MTQKNNSSPAEIVQNAAEDFLKKGVSGKDAIDIHLQAMDMLTKGLEDNLASRIFERARFLLLGVLANMVDHK